MGVLSRALDGPGFRKVGRGLAVLEESRMGQELLAERDERLTSVADRRLLLEIEFAERAAERRIEKDRVVAEAVGALGLRCDLAVHDAFGFRQHAAVIG